MKLSKIFIVISFLLILISIALSLYNFNGQKKIGFVITGELVSKYNGMEDAQEEFNKKYIERQREIDTLIAIYDNKVENYKLIESGLKLNQKDLAKENIMILGEKITNYKKNMEDAATKENNKMIEGVLNQINSFVERFAEYNNYDYIIGVTEYGNVLYAKEKYDITNELIDAINSEYDN